MKKEVDSKNKILPYSVIMSQVITEKAEKNGDDSKELAKSFFEIEGVMSAKDTKMYQINNTVFIVKSDQKGALVIPFNLDKNLNYAQNIEGLVNKLEEQGVSVVVFSKIEPRYLNTFTTLKANLEQKGKSVKINTIKGSILCVIAVQGVS